MKVLRGLVLLLAAACVGVGGERSYVTTPAMFTAGLSAGDTGALEVRDTLTVGTLRPQAAVTVREAFEGPVRSYEAGNVFIASVSGRTAPPTALSPESEGVLWCDPVPPPTFGVPVRTCFRDSTGDGRFDSAFLIERADTKSLFETMPVVASAWTGGASYEPVEPVGIERPFGYGLCSLEGTPRFASIRALPDGSFGTMWVGGCYFGSFTDDGLLEVDALRLRTTREEGRLLYEVVAVPPGGPVHFREPGAPLLPAAQANPANEAVAALLQILSESPFEATGSVDLSEAAGIRQPGDVIASLPVTYAVTGVLKEAFPFRVDVANGWLGSKEVVLPAGTPVYGVRYGTLAQLGRAPESLDVTWCALEETETGTLNSLCFPLTRGGGTVHERLGGVLFAESFRSNTAVRDVTPVVERKDIDLGEPMTLSIELVKAGEGSVRIARRLRTASGQEQRICCSDLRVNAGHAIFFLAEEARLILTPGAEGVAVTIEGGPVIGEGSGVY